jgi:hypothetical protein
VLLAFWTVVESDDCVVEDVAVDLKAEFCRDSENCWCNLRHREVLRVLLQRLREQCGVKNSVAQESRYKFLEVC